MKIHEDDIFGVTLCIPVFLFFVAMLIWNACMGDWPHFGLSLVGVAIPVRTFLWNQTLRGKQ